MSTDTGNKSSEKRAPESGKSANNTEQQLSSGTIATANLHQLQNTWTLWFYKSDNSRKWEDNLREVVKFSTVEHFWGLYNHVIQPAALQQGCDFCLFKAGIRPMWEDARNQNGGRWVISLDKRDREAHLNAYWLDLLLLLIGEFCADELADTMCGAVVNVRAKGDKISFWISVGSGKQPSEKHKEQVIAIGHVVRDRLQLLDTTTFHFEAHQGNTTFITLPPRAQ